MRRPPRSTLLLRISEPLHDRLREAAEERDLSMNYLVTRAIEDFLDRLLPADAIKFTR